MTSTTKPPMSLRASVVIPTHNRCHLLQRALDSVLAQQDVDVEVIVVDDGSTDDTPRRLSELADARVRAIRNEQSLGVAAARNRGIAKASHPWVAFLDDDDYWAPAKLRAQFRALEGAPNARFVWGTALLVDEVGAIIDVLRTDQKAGSLDALLRRNSLGPPSVVMVSTELVRALGGFNERLRVIADWDLWIRLASRAAGVPCTEPVVAYVQHRSNMYFTESDRLMAEFAVMENAHSDLARKHDIQLGETARARWRALAHERSGHRAQAALSFVVAGLRARDPRLALRALGSIGGARLISNAHRASRKGFAEPDWLRNS